MKAVMYHYIRLPQQTLPHFKFLHVEDFANQLNFFEKEYGFVKKNDFFNALRSRKPSPGIVLTFDDGLKDHYRFVLPELKRRNLWAFFFVCTGVYQTKRLLNVHRIHMLLGGFGGKTIFDALKGMVTKDMLTYANIKAFNETYGIQLNDEYTTLVKKWLNYLIGHSYQNAVLDKLMLQFYGREDELANEFYLSEEEIKLMHNDGMVIGSHTVNHPVMSKLDFGSQQAEVVQSFNWLAKLTGGMPAKTFCYPYGGLPAFNSNTEQILNDAGVACSFNVESRDILEKDLLSRRQALPRYDCNEFAHGQAYGS